MALASYSYLIIHASPSLRPAAAPQKKAECFFVSATGRLFDGLLDVSPDNRRAQTELPLAKVSGKPREMDKMERRIRKSCRRQQGKDGRI